MDVVLQQLVNAITLSAMYALIAVGVTLFFGVLGIVNLAHGDIAMLGVFMSLAAYRVALLIPGIDPITAGIIGAFCGTTISAVAGWLMYQIAFRPLSSAPPIIGLIASVGAGFTIRESILNFYPDGRNPQQFPEIVPVKAWLFGDTVILQTQVLILVVSIVSVICLATLIERTRLGRAMRAIVNNPEMAKLLGVPVNVVIGVAFLLGSALAGVAGVLNGLYYNVIQFDMGLSLTTKGFTAAVIGGLGSMYGALVGAVIVGIIEAFTAGFLPDGSAYKEIAIFLTLSAILIIRPTGIIKQQSSEKV